MNSEERKQLESQSATLRRELKKWEKEFAAANENRKATRDEIKQNPEIAQKYKEYNKVRDILSGKQPKPSSTTTSSPSQRKRKADETQPVETPSAKRHHGTPRKTQQPDFFDTYDSPSIIRNLFTPTKKQWISPTPQKNGVYYGLFDLMEEEENATTTPKAGNAGNAALLQATPSRKTAVNWDELPFASTRKHSRTPTSASRRQMLDRYTLTTPLKSRSGPDGGRTPSSSVSKLHFPTPSFLRRDNRLATTYKKGEDAGGLLDSPPMIRGPRKPLVRGLSSILAGLRKLNEEAEDEDLEALREMENESNIRTAKPAKNEAASKPEPEIQVEDSQVNHLLSGFDDESKFDNDSDAEPVNRDGPEKIGKDGKPPRTYKKKGQKRTTRRSKIRPTAPKKALPHDVGKGFDSEPEPEETDGVPETQEIPWNGDDEEGGGSESEIPDISETSGIIPFDSKDLSPGLNPDEEEDSGSDWTASSGGTRYRKADQSEHLARLAERRQALKANSGAKGKGVGVVGNVKKGVRKVTALAGQNFRRLKLRGKGAKSGGAGKGRFGRR